MRPPLHRVVSGARVLSAGNRRAPNRFLARSTGGMGRRNPALRVLSNPENFDSALVKGMARRAVVDLPTGVSRQVSAWIRSGELVDDTGAPWLPADRQGAAVPLLVLAGNLDHVAPAANVEAACAIFPNCRAVVASRETGFSIDYGHIDIVLGTTAKAEIYPMVAEFLEDHAREAGDEPLVPRR